MKIKLTKNMMITRGMLIKALDKHIEEHGKDSVRYFKGGDSWNKNESSTASLEWHSSESAILPELDNQDEKFVFVNLEDEDENNI